MSNKKIVIIFMVFFFIIFMYKESFTLVGSLKEPFTPGLQTVYRPYIRSWRVYTEKTYDGFSKKIRVILSKFGII
uniref:Uncharacterized protein n=1 Tax=viral metagenome TaxID=1070528 RepID=A0A6C0BBQ9_9ZZZZ